VFQLFKLTNPRLCSNFELDAKKQHTTYPYMWLTRNTQADADTNKHAKQNEEACHYGLFVELLYGLRTSILLVTTVEGS
jgi:hypothetical protein